jgi:nondiscriminating glutamyl-tRNA synthetase
LKATGIFDLTMHAIPDKLVKTRFAPSPTGYLHLGNARTALFNALLAQKHGGVFLLRIEDTDGSRSRPEYEQALLQDLRWLGLLWQQGPDTDSPHGPYSQSQRGEIYERHYAALAERGLAYPCFCTAQELKQVRRAQLAAGRPPRYPGTCATLSQSEVQRRLGQGLRPAHRFRVPKDEMVEFEDLVRGFQRYRSDDIGDFVIRRSDLTPAFFFSNAVDDAVMGISHVLRGEDHLANTPRQLLVLKALQYQAPAYGHIALLIGDDGSPLSKRRGTNSLRHQREEGYLPQAVNNYLARLGHVYDETRYLPPDELAEGFDIPRLGRAPARFDESQLRYWQKEAVTHTSDAALWDWLADRRYADNARIEDRVPETSRMDFVRAIRDNIELPPEALKLADDLFQKLPDYSAKAKQNMCAAGDGFFEAALAQMPSKAADFSSYARAVGKATGVKGKDLFMPLRAALTGDTHGPEMARVFPLIGIERARARLQTALKIASNHAADSQ